ncbi:hypothetical protein A1F94_012807 [Pyrenophora tritici-repentis]|nr:hypothetical protein A1F94_012807 [Pyrenophora tritici-repentis]
MQLRDSIPEDAIVAPVEASEVAAAAFKAVDKGELEPDFDPRIADNFNGINWSRLPRNTNRIFWLCHICHKRKAATTGFAETTEATSTAARHLNRDYRITNASEQPPQQLLRGQKSLEIMLKGGFGVSQRVANEIGNFDVQSFRIAAISWLVDNNLALCQFEDPAFRMMIHFTNPEAEQAHKRGKRGFFGIVAHFATAEGDLRDVAIDLPQLSGAYTGDRIADCVAKTLQKFNITAQNEEEKYLNEWRKQGPLGTLIDVISYIKTPQQYDMFANFQRLARQDLPADDDAKFQILEPVLKPLKDTTKRLKGRGKCRRFVAIYEVIPVFEFLMGRFEQRLRQYERVDFEQREAPEDHISINFRAAKLDDSPAYFAACALHPYYRRYCEKAWRDKPEWLVACMADFQRDNGAIDEAISYIISDSEDDDELTDEYDRWRKLELKWTSKQHNSPNVDGNPIKY